MAALSDNGIVGRDILFYKGDADTGILFCARTKTVSVGAESIDVTSDCDDGFRTLLGKPAQRQIDMSVEGVIRQDDFAKLFLNPNNSTFIEDYTLEIPGIGSVTGDFFLNSFEIGATYNDASTFTCSVESSGPWSFDPEVVAS